MITQFNWRDWRLLRRIYEDLVGFSKIDIKKLTPQILKNFVFKQLHVKVQLESFSTIMTPIERDLHQVQKAIVKKENFVWNQKNKFSVLT